MNFNFGNVLTIFASHAHAAERLLEGDGAIRRAQLHPADGCERRRLCARAREPQVAQVAIEREPLGDGAARQDAGAAARVRAMPL